jgi:hypothetical protein
MSQKTFSVDEILWAFIESPTTNARHPAGVSAGGGPRGYVRLKGPSGGHQVVIERHNATVAVEEIHSQLPGVGLRPALPKAPRKCSKRITEHALGYSVGPEMANLRWGISAEDLANSYANPAAFVEAIVKACPAGSPW